MKINDSPVSAIAFAFAMLAMNGAVQAERPMNVDDAGTLDEKGTKLELGWRKAGELKGLDGAVGYAPIEHLELELNFNWARDGSVTPRDMLRGYGAAAKWVPITADVGLSAGLKYAYGHEAVDSGGSASAQSLIALMSWSFAEQGPVVHVNLGHDWLRAEGEHEGLYTWGVGLDFPFTDAFHGTLETFGFQHTGPIKAIGLRYEIVEGLKVSSAFGSGNDRTFANLGVAWEF